MRALREMEMTQVGGGRSGTGTATVVCTTSKTTHADGSVTESETCEAKLEVVVD